MLTPVWGGPVVGAESRTVPVDTRHLMELGDDALWEGAGSALAPWGRAPRTRSMVVVAQR